MQRKRGEVAHLVVYETHDETSHAAITLEFIDDNETQAFARSRTSRRRSADDRTEGCESSFELARVESGGIEWVLVLRLSRISINV